MVDWLPKAWVKLSKKEGTVFFTVHYWTGDKPKDIEIKSEEAQRNNLWCNWQGSGQIIRKYATLVYWLFRSVNKSWSVQGEEVLTLLFPWANKFTMWKTSFLHRKVERYLYHQRYGIKDCKGCINSGMTSLLAYNPQAQTSFSCNFLTNILVLCLKAIKIICFGHFFESHISMISYIYKIEYAFFSINLPYVSFWVFGQSKNQEGKKEKFPPNIIFFSYF